MSSSLTLQGNAKHRGTVETWITFCEDLIVGNQRPKGIQGRIGSLSTIILPLASRGMVIVFMGVV